ncbi:MAG: flotillin-like protein FloA [Lentisphaerae bacterium]|nr:flotillin-like protein FloA [Lentisphaerota bacterium]MCP4102016.1 flotillin-like protein FloA [Lentisphaerota bacterium]
MGSLLTIASIASIGTIGTVALIAIIIFILIIFCVVIPIPLWIAAVFSGVKIKISSLVGMRLRRVPPQVILSAMIQAIKAGLEVNSNDLEAHFLAGGNVFRVVQALVVADKANIPLSLQRATAIDLAGRNLLEAVKMSVNPKVIETPMVTAVAKDGIQLRAIARVTVRANIDRLVGGAGEETILARVGEGIVTTIGSAHKYKNVLENPDTISKVVLDKGLDSGTAYEILSIDIADVDVGKNIGAELQMAQANADKDIAQAKAEERRAMAVAQEQEMKAKIREMEAKLVDAEAEIPMAISEALAGGTLGIMDYYKMKNVMADTDMRKAIASPADKTNDKNRK